MLAARQAIAVEVRMNLKVCERCGVLWCRKIGMEERYCERCVKWMLWAERPTPMELRVGRPFGPYAVANKANNGEGGVQ